MQGVNEALQCSSPHEVKFLLRRLKQDLLLGMYKLIFCVLWWEGFVCACVHAYFKPCLIKNLKMSDYNVFNSRYLSGTFQGVSTDRLQYISDSWSLNCFHFLLMAG